MDSTLKIQFDLTPRLEKVLTAIADSVNALTKGTIVPTPTKEAETASPAPEAPAVAEQKAPEAPAVEAPKPAPEAPAEPATKISDEEISAAIAECKARVIVPADDREIKKQVVTTLKAKIVELGATCSHDLPQDKRAAFIEFCNTMTLEDKVPF